MYSFDCALKDIKVHQNLSEVIKSHQNPTELIKTHQSSSKLIKTHWNSSKLIKTHQNSSKLIETHQNSSKLIIKLIKTQQSCIKMCILSIAHIYRNSSTQDLYEITLILSWAASNFLRRRELRLCLLLLKTWVDYCRCILSERHLWLRPIICCWNFLPKLKV